MKPKDIERLVGLVLGRYRAMVASVELSLPVADIEEARAHLRGIFGSIKVVSDEREIRVRSRPARYAPGTAQGRRGYSK